MSTGFLTPLRLEKKSKPDCDGNNYFTISELRYETQVFEKTVVLVVPAGYCTDLASTPNTFYYLNKYIDAAAVLHDYLYKQAFYSKSTCDLIFYEACKLTLPKSIAYTCYLGVKWFGHSKYGN